ncbi:interferon-induced protein 44-like [Mercenaria mercenaria]|uniref:interferon-induced protein 44-like n=1 Tax=Mercenaria mercenaria TaxID=6596 RepID=UPI00234E62BA|nr:interferon-induced protein 44-like [Mercenaria mercenaria]
MDKTVSAVVVADSELSDSSGKIAKDNFAVMFNALAAKPPPDQSESVTPEDGRIALCDTARLASFSPATEEEVKKLVQQSANLELLPILTKVLLTMNDTSSLLKEIGLKICGHADKKSFNILYRADTEVKVDEFHSKCDGKGPTVTVLYLKNNTIYGGYTSEDWSSDRRKTKADKHAFLFYKNDHVDEKCNFIPIAEDMQSKAITCDANFGPTFGWGALFTKRYDLQTFKKDSKSESEYRDGSLILNGAMNIGCAYETESRNVRRDIVSKFPGDESAVPEQTHVADPLIIKRIVVYQVVDTLQDIELQEMKKRIEDFQPVPGLGIKKYNILLLGAIGSGKSSFYNTMATVFSGSVKLHAPARGAERSVTDEMILAYELKSKSGKHLNLQIFDTRGFQENRGYNNELEKILNGRLPVEFTFPDQSAPVKEDELTHASLKQEMHMVCFVTGTSNLDTITNEQRLPMVVVVTKFDAFSESILEDANQVYRCLEARDAIKRMPNVFGIQEKYIFPIVNYINDDEIKEGNDRLALQALDAMVRLTNDYLENLKGIIIYKLLW